LIPFTHCLRCTVCKAQLRLSAIRDLEPRTKTAFTVCCPACHNEVHGEIPLSIMLASVQIVSYERPKKEPRLKASA
jgi:hypothetical protein